MDDKRDTANEVNNGDPSIASPTRRAFIYGLGTVPLSESLLSDTQIGQRKRAETTASQTRRFTVHAIEVDIIFNRVGLHQPNGAMYVLEENLEAVKKASGVIPDDGFDPITGESAGDDIDTSVIEPLTIRANEGEIVEITFVNHLSQPASMHQTGLSQDPTQSDGMNVGENPSTIAQPGETITYRWHAAHQGGHIFYDGAHQGYDSPDAPPEKANHLSRGLFGALIVEPSGATWTDPVTGGPLRSGTKADIHDPNFMGTSYREFVPHYHTPSGVYLPDGSHKTWPSTGEEQTTHAINYRAEGVGTRVNDEFEDSNLKRTFYSTWINGDPGGGENVFHAYKGDPVKFVPVGASLEENHVHHLHNHRWKTVPTRTDSDTIDAQTIGLGASYPSYLVAAHGQSSSTAVHDPEQTVRPNMTFREAFEVGAGYVQGGAGDILFHCHLFPHYAEGMWAIMRVHDKEQPFLQPLPNTRVVDDTSSIDLPLQDGILGSETDVPGYPDYVPGAKGEFPPKTVSGPGTTNPRTPTPAEKKAGLSTDTAGAPYNDPVVADDAPERDHTIHVIDETELGNVVYNDRGDYDPEALLYVHEDDVEAAKNGDLNPEPLFLRANVGDAVNVTVVNETEFPITIHPHFVGFDPQATDSTPSIGMNYEQSVEPGEERTYRWYADEEGTIFFHDHTVGISEAMHGTFAGLIVEPEGSEHLDPYSGEPINSGAQAIIKNPGGNDFREFALHYNDFVPLRDKDDGDFVNPQREHNQNLGTQAINNRNAPYYHRDDEGPAYVHSSAVHGDPPTPLLEAYSNDPIRIRLFQGSWEDQHNFQIHGRQIQPEGLEEQDTVSQIIDPSEAFTFMIDPYDAPGQTDFERMPNPSGLPVQDYMYGSGIVDDRFTGMWGVHRVFDAEVPQLEPLPDRGPPSGRITADQLREMGHSAPFVGIDRLKDIGQRARLLYKPGDDRSLTPDTVARKNPNVGDKPPKPPDPGDPCPKGTRVRKFDVTAHQVDIHFNDHGDHDPNGIVFTLKEYVNEVKEHVNEVADGERHPEPLTLRANQGDCIEVRLTNELPTTVGNDHDDPPMRVPRGWEPSERVSLHPQRITYDPNGSDGATVGFNYDQTVGPGEEITYRWYAADLYDNMVLTDEADVRGHRHHGAFGNLIVEPPKTVWLDSTTGEALPEGVDAILKRPGEADVREYSLSTSDGRYVVNSDNPDSCVVPAGHEGNSNASCNEVGGFEDGGHGAINNRAEPFVRRFEHDPAQHKVYDSAVHGDPATPVLRAQLGDPVKFLVHQPGDKARGMSFHLSGHQWRRWRGVPESPVVGVDDRISPGKGIRLGLTSDAGGHQQAAGDYIYQDTKQRRRLESGLWGIFRVRDGLADFEHPMHPLPDRAEDALPREHPGWNVVRDDITGDGTNDLVIGVPDSDVGAKNGGAVYIFENRSGPVTDLSAADMALLGTVPEQRAGTTVRVRGKGNAPVIAIGTASGDTITVPAGTPAADAIADPARTAARAFVMNTTENDLGAVHKIDNVRNGFPRGNGGGGGRGGGNRGGGNEGRNGGGSSNGGGSENGNGVSNRASNDNDAGSDLNSSSSRDATGSSAGPMRFLRCTGCGQKSASAGEASRWSTTDAADDGESAFECEACGNHQKGTEL